MMFFQLFRNKKIFNEGFLPEADGHKIYFMEVGNPKGAPVLCFHGGPGESSRLSKARFFNLKKYRVIFFDQRGCGKSLPTGKMEKNTSQDSVEDARRLLRLLNIEKKIIVKGSSWGSTLALLFAIEYPDIVSRLIINKVFLANKENTKWTTETSKLFYPDIYEQLIQETNGKIVKHYQNMINSNDLEKQKKATLLFSGYESSLGTMKPKIENQEISFERIMATKIFINYFAKDFFIKEDFILNNIKKIQDIKTLIVHNRIDMVSPLKNAYSLHKAMPYSKLVINPEFGHWGKELSKVIEREINLFLVE